MALVKISRGADIQHNYVNGVSRVSVLEGTYKDATVERISLQPGADFSIELYSRQQHNQVFLITAGKGYIVTPRRVFNITEVSVFVPDFDKESVTFHCAADAKGTMEIVHFVTELNDYDKTCLKEAHMSLPRFRGVSGAWHYKENFTGADIQQMMLLEHRNLGRLSMGCVKGNGPIEIGQHIHNELAQWYFPLPGSDFIYTAGGEEVHMTGGDLSYTPTGFWHGSRVEANKKCDYIWFEMCIEGYPGEIK